MKTSGQSNLADKRLAATTKASKVWFSFLLDCILANGAVFHSVWQVWLSSGSPEVFTVSYCAWLWNWIIDARRLWVRSSRSAVVKRFYIWRGNSYVFSLSSLFTFCRYYWSCTNKTFIFLYLFVKTILSFKNHLVTIIVFVRVSSVQNFERIHGNVVGKCILKICFQPLPSKALFSCLIEFQIIQSLAQWFFSLSWSLE